MSVATPTIEQLAINTIRTLSMDAVQAANSGHPGTPMALAPVAFQVWTTALRYDPSCAAVGQPRSIRTQLRSCFDAAVFDDPSLTGIKAVDHDGKVLSRPSITLDNIKKFRQLGSPCAGHPEYGEAAGIETTTGPLGQGCGNSVGLAIASKWLGGTYNRPGFDLFDYNVYTLCGDGDLMEGVAYEAASIAGHLKLSNLCWMYDDNHITIEGETDLAFSEDVGKRFEGMGWNVLRVADANDFGQHIKKGLDGFHACKDKPTLIIVRSVIGYGSPNKANSHGAHGAPLGEEEIKLTKKFYGWPEDEKFLVPEVPAYFADKVGARGAAAHKEWQATFDKYRAQYPQEAAEVDAIVARKLPAGWDAGLKPFEANEKGLATRVSSGKVLNMLAPKLRWLVGGSADLAPSTMTLLDGEKDFEAHNYAGRNFHFGIREHGMGSVLNGMSLSGSAGLWRHVLCLHRLHATSHAIEQHHASTGAVCAHSRFDRTRVKTVLRISQSNIWPPAAQFLVCMCIDLGMPTKSSSVIDRFSRKTNIQQRWCSRVRTHRHWIAPSWPRPLARSRAVIRSAIVKAHLK